jgi:Zn-dependent peptidase ImmA (M78 family)/transcriptional regulator with XRE-family HTH domain
VITPARLRQARELRGLTQTALARQVGVHPSAIAQLETGRMQPSPAVLDALSRATGFPPAFFTRPSGPALPLGSLRFRARAAMTARQHRQAWAYTQMLYELMASLAVQTDYPAPRLPRLPGDAVAAAASTREALGLVPDRPIGPLIRTLERAGVWVLAIPVPLPRRDACSAWAGGDGATPVLVVAATPAGHRRRFSVAHELGHLVLHHLPEGTPHVLEQQADAFAEAFLLPETAMRAALLPPITLTTLAALKARWGVSLQALIRRALTLEIISPSQYRSLSAQLGARGWRTQEPIAVPVERPRALRQLAERLYGRPIDYSRLADTMGLDPVFVQELLAAYAAGSEVPRTV